MIPVLIAINLITALFLLAILASIDLRTRLLPNIFVFPFGLLGLIFHGLSAFYFASPLQIFLGALAGGGTLLLVRTAANYYYKQDTLGLGDVKLMAAAGLWLGPEHIFLALSLGAFFGVLHGLGHAVYKKVTAKAPINLAKLSIPAGPGFICGIILTALIKFYWT